MFKSARIKLTSWYLLIIMFVSLFFSLLIYRVVALELERGFRRAEIRHHAEMMGMNLPPHFSLRSEDLRPELRELAPRFLFVEDLEEAKWSVFYRLIILNGSILLISAFLSYLVAGKTLAPIEKAMKEQKRFTADASHELKTPLTALQTSIEVALRNKKLQLKDAKTVLHENLEDIGDLNKLTNDLLSLARYQRGNNNFVKTSVNIRDVATDILKRIAPLAEKKNITINKKLESVTLNANKESIEKLFTILLDNAVKYTPLGGSITLELCKEKRYIKIVAKDTGVGISKKDILHIFDRFYRVDESRTKQRVAGFGLGLSIAKEIVELYKGSINVDSTLRKGSAFIINLPIKN